MMPIQVDKVDMLCREVQALCELVRKMNSVKDPEKWNMSWYNGISLPYPGVSSVTIAALRRRSMDLTRALAAMRR